MFNNFQNLFQKYSQKISLQKGLEEKVIILIKDFTNIILEKESIKINQKDKTIKIINLASSKMFFLIQKIKANNLEEKIKTELEYRLLF
jgi:sulfur transfer complex TusBCD TusB component (DsrH family)